MRPIVVYDTNILISGMVWGGVPYDCIKLAMTDKVEGVTCSEIISEFDEKLTTKLGYTHYRISRIVSRLLGFLRVVKITNKLEKITTDPDDNKIIECAIVSGATHIVTGDKRHLLPLKNYQSIRHTLCTPFAHPLCVGLCVRLCVLCHFGVRWRVQRRNFDPSTHTLNARKRRFQHVTLLTLFRPGRTADRTHSAFLTRNFPLYPTDRTSRR